MQLLLISEGGLSDAYCGRALSEQNPGPQFVMLTGAGS